MTDTAPPIPRPRRRPARLSRLGIGLGLALSVMGTAAHAQDPSTIGGVEPGVLLMLEKAAARDGGAKLETVVLIAIEATPSKAPDILAVVKKLAPEKADAIHAAVVAAFPGLQLATPSSKIAAQSDKKAARTAEAAEQKAESASMWRLSGWDGSVELAANRSTGNSDQTAAGLIVKALHESGSWTNKLNGLFDLERNDGETTKRRWLLGYDLNYAISDRSYVFGSLQYENDRFAGIDYRFTENAGFGYQLIRSEDLTFNIEAGPGSRQTEFLDGADKETEFTGLMRTELVWAISDSASLTHDFVLIWGTDQKTINSTAAIKLKIIGALSGRFSYNYRYNSAPPDLKRETDTVARAGLVYDF